MCGVQTANRRTSIVWCILIYGFYSMFRQVIRPSSGDVLVQEYNCSYMVQNHRIMLNVSNSD